MLEAAKTLRSQMPRLNTVGALLLLAGRRTTKGTATPDLKVTLPSAPLSTLFTTLAITCVKLLRPQGSQVYFTLCLVRKLKSRRTLTSSAATPAHATAMHFPVNGGLIFLINKLTHDRYVVDTGATLSIVHCTSKTNPSGPLLKGVDGQPIPSWGFVHKTVQFQGKLFTFKFLLGAVASIILGIDILRKFKVNVAPETNQILFACIAAAPSAPKSFFNL
jgi:hypothetical protein